MQMQTSEFRNYTLKAKITGYVNNPIQVKFYTYTLSQYSPSVYAEIYFYINEEDFLDFKKIDQLKIENRIIELWYEPELYHERLNINYNSGPFKFCIIQYEHTNTAPNIEDTQYRNMDITRLVKLKCIDPVLYKMTLDEKMASFGETSISEIVRTIVTTNGGKIKTNIGTSYKYRWLQLSMTDYNMIRSMLPYAKSTAGDLSYTFFMFNKEAIFAPINHGKVSPVQIVLDESIGVVSRYSSTDLKAVIENLGSEESLMMYDSGYEDDELVKPDKIKTEAYRSDLPANKQHIGVAKKFVRSSITDKNLRKIYMSNIRHRVHSFSKIIKISVPVIPELTPVDCVELIKQKDGQIQDLDGIYYILEINYTYGAAAVSSGQIAMHLTLCSELDMLGYEKAEGKPVE